MGKRKSREFISNSSESFEQLSTNFRKLDKLRLDLERTYVKQRKILHLIRNEIPDATNHRARNIIQEVTNEVRRLLDRSEEYLTLTCDLKIRQYQRGEDPHLRNKLKGVTTKIEREKNKLPKVSK